MMTTWKEHWLLDPQITFLNHGSFGACPRSVLERQQELRERMEREPVRFVTRELDPLLEAAREEMAAFLGAEPAELVFVPNATYGVNSILRSLELRPGDELLVTDHEYRACRNALDYVAARARARIVVARIPFPLDDPAEVVSAVCSLLSARTRLLLVDHVTSPTGMVLPVARLVEELAERGIDTLVDGAHAPGMLALDLGALGAAYYTGNCHKWLCAPKGVAILHVRRDRQEGVHPLAISHGSSIEPCSRSRFHLEFDWTGTFDPTAVLSLPEALRFLGDLLPGGWDALRARNRSLALEARSILCAALGIEAPCPAEMIGSLAAVILPPGEQGPADSLHGSEPLHNSLFDRYRIEVPVHHWPGSRARLLRISAQIYNEREEYERLAAALVELLAEERN